VALFLAGIGFRVQSMTDRRNGGKRIQQVADPFADLLVTASGTGVKFDFGVLIFHAYWIFSKIPTSTDRRLTITMKSNRNFQTGKYIF